MEDLSRDRELIVDDTGTVTLPPDILVRLGGAGRYTVGNLSSGYISLQGESVESLGKMVLAQTCPACKHDYGDSDDQMCPLVVHPTNGGGKKQNLFRISGILETISTIILHCNAARHIEATKYENNWSNTWWPIHPICCLVYGNRDMTNFYNLAILAMAAAIPPGGPIWVERKYMNSDNEAKVSN